jgi:hypothetical protein
MSSDGNGSSGREERQERPNRRLSLWPLTVEEAAEAMLRVKPPPKKARGPKPGRSSKNGAKPKHVAE